MVLTLLLLLPVLGGVLAWITSRWNARAGRWLALSSLLLDLLLITGVWITSSTAAGPWLLSVNVSWIPQLGIGFHLAMDGISLLLLALTALLGIMAVITSWVSITERVGLFHFMLLFSLSAITGIFLAMDLFLFYLFWELLLVPLYFLIDIWGHEHRHYAAIKLFLFTQLGGLFLLLSILGLAIIHERATGTLTFDYFLLLGTPVSGVAAFWLMLAMFVAFAVKLPAVPLHPWLPDAHTQAPVAGSVDLAGLVLKVGAYGFFRFLIPLFPAAGLAFTPVAMTLGVIGILYGALLAFAQTDLKRLVAYTSISHMGFVLIGIFAWNTLALQGVLIIMLAHGISTGALFILVGMINRRLGTRDMAAMGGLWSVWPRLGGAGLFLAMATLGLPALGNFIGEFLVLLGTFRVSPVFAILAALGFIVSLVYALWMFQRVFTGPPPADVAQTDLTSREWIMLVTAILVTLWIGVYPQTFIDTATPAIRTLMQRTGIPAMPTSQRGEVAHDRG